MSHTGMVAPSHGAAHHTRTCSGLVIASHTRWRGASNTRWSRISLSEGRVTSSLPLPFPAMTLLLGFEVFEQGVEALEAAFPVIAVALEPAAGLAHRNRFEPARPPLRVAPARDQAGALEHLEVLRDRGLTHRERFRELH